MGEKPKEKKDIFMGFEKPPGAGPFWFMEIFDSRKEREIARWADKKKLN
jgi:hypothetical protein